MLVCFNIVQFGIYLIDRLYWSTRLNLALQVLTPSCRTVPAPYDKIHDPITLTIVSQRQSFNHRDQVETRRHVPTIHRKTQTAMRSHTWLAGHTQVRRGQGCRQKLLRVCRADMAGAEDEAVSLWWLYCTWTVCPGGRKLEKESQCMKTIIYFLLYPSMCRLLFHCGSPCHEYGSNRGASLEQQGKKKQDTHIQFLG